jgi:hypothetical protein
MLDDLDRVCLSHDPSAVLSWQLELLEELAWCESARTGDNADALRLHKDLIRYIGDGLMWQFLTPMAFRAFSREYSKPPGIIGQWTSIGHVINVARELADAGIVPLITDLAHALQNGDIVGVSAERLFIIECKDRDAPLDSRLGGRLGRQISAMKRAASYLAGDIHGASEETEPLWIALPPGDKRAFSFGALVSAITESRDRGEALEVVEDGDLFLVSRTGVPSRELMQRATSHFGPVGHGRILIGGPHRLMTEPPHEQAPLSSWPISVEDRADLMSQELVALHIVNLTPFLLIEDPQIRVSYNSGSGGFTCSHEGVTFEFGNRFINDVLVGCEARATASSTFHSKLREFTIRGVIDIGEPTRAITLVAYRDGFVMPMDSSTRASC